ncbi:MAG: bifunctional UDP-sugar hydrolase/5'-nucleotidase [Lagierella massiliensis]|nr:bifunctional UDP-sugar hydrolase/5'-nucleotidase [Lagierella massiliensis]
MGNYKNLTILHSNDMHGDFYAKNTDEKLIGGVSMLSGYVNKTRKENKNVIYAIAGDMFTGSVIDSEFKGISTIEIMNMIAPDVVTLGNHEVDYGIAHLLFLEKCARFPIINANMHIVNKDVRLFKSHKIINIDGMSILFIGILTEEVLSHTKADLLVGSLVDVWEAAEQVGKICNSYKTVDIDFTVLLTHIGIEEDKKLAEILDPRWGVDIIIGGHSHTKLDEPVIVNNIPIVQAAVGTNQIGRFDIVVDTDNNCISSFDWKLVEINNENCPRDIALEEIITSYKNKTDDKYNRYLTRFLDEYTHPRRDRETELGRLFADILKENTLVDIMLLGSGSIRKNLGPIVLFKDLIECMPYNEEIYSVIMTGSQLLQALEHIHRKEAYDGEETEFYQYSKGFKLEYSLKENKILNVEYENEPIDLDKEYKVGLYKFHFNNSDNFLNLAYDDLKKKSRLITSSSHDLINEHFLQTEYLEAPKDQRWIVIE